LIHGTKIPRRQHQGTFNVAKLWGLSNGNDKDRRFLQWVAAYMQTEAQIPATTRIFPGNKRNKTAAVTERIYADGFGSGDGFGYGSPGTPGVPGSPPPV
jgi:hypothetical protein